MPLIRADLHLHSHHSMATSREADLPRLAWWANRKGLQVVGSGDFTHPAWRAELAAQLQPAEPGLWRLRPAWQPPLLPGTEAPRFLLSGEVSTIYQWQGRVRKVHHLLCAPSLAAVERLSEALTPFGKLAVDGRPTLKLDPRDLLELVLGADPDCWLIPAHVWTPWYSALGARSGFDALDDCYRDLAGHLLALETGLSSDPPMNWRVSALDRYRLVSHSDAHSPAKLGREATVYHTELDYYAMGEALRSGRGYGGTIEFFPEEGKYYLDGHRRCGTVALPNPCPVCGRPLTQGVLSRVQALADRPAGAVAPNAGPFVRVAPLETLLQAIGVRGVQVRRRYLELTARLGPELDLLLDLPVTLLDDPPLALALTAMRQGRLAITPGYDGQFGRIAVVGAP